MRFQSPKLITQIEKKNQLMKNTKLLFLGKNYYKFTLLNLLMPQKNNTQTRKKNNLKKK